MESFQHFWRQYPALLYALTMLIGIEAALAWNSLLLLPLVIIFVPLLCGRGGWIRLTLAACLMIGAFCWAKSAYSFPFIPSNGVAGAALIEISSVSSASTSFGKRWVYKGKIKAFKPLDHTKIDVRNVSYTLSMAQRAEIHRPPANRAYCVEGRLKESSPGHYVLVVAKNQAWFPVSGSWSIAEWRFQVKETVSAYIRHHISGRQAQTFLAGIATGNFDDRVMQFEFGRFGLQHIMAISGFHFAIIAGILSFLARLVMDRRKAMIFLMVLLSGYFLFLGCGASIIRAWATSVIALMGLLLERRSSGLNSLGAALMVVLLYDPLLCQNLGFQFSFAVTAAILMLYPTSDFLMQQILTKRSLSEMIEMDALNQHAYCILTFFRQAIALTIAVNLIALPMMLYYFHKFPLLSLLYNIFFPFMVSVSMLFLLLGLFCGICPPIASAIHALNSMYTQFMLNFTHNLPTKMDIIWRVPAFPIELLICYLCFIFALSIYLKRYLTERQQVVQELVC